MKQIINIVNGQWSMVILLIAYCLLPIAYASAQAPLAIPYQAVARDAAGNLIANQNVSLRFSVHDGSAAGVVQYRETDLAFTNALGLFTTNIGQGTPVGGTLFSGIIWASGAKYMQVEIDVTGGTSYVDMGTQQMMSVPYALYAVSSGSSTGGVWTASGNDIYSSNSGNVGIGTATPEFKLSLDNDGGIMAKGTQGSGAGLTTAGGGTRMFWYPKKSAIRAGSVDGTQWDDANVGLVSTAFGENTTANGNASTAMGNGSTAGGAVSTAMGYQTVASGDYSTALGHYSNATGPNSTAMGGTTDASGNNSTAMGNVTTASGVASTAMGYISTASGDYSTAMGNGSTAGGAVSTAMGNGSNAIGDYSTALGKFSNANGNASTAMGNGSTAGGAVSTAMGYQTVASGDYSTALGHYSNATGPNSTAMGGTTNASGNNSTAMGNITTASGVASTAMGYISTASGDYSTAMGDITTAGGVASTAMGDHTTASGDYSTAIGKEVSTNNHAGSFISGDCSTGINTNNTANNQFMVRAAGGYVFYNDASLTTPNTMSFTGGNLGIGTITPQEKLEVAGNVTSSGSVAGYRFADRTLGYSNGWQWYASGGIARLYDHTNNVDRMVINSAGRVGIGTGAPTAMLHVESPDMSTVAILGNSTGNFGTGVLGVGLGVASFGVSGSSLLGTGGGFFTNTGTAGYFQSNTNTGQALVTTGGLVGIGTLSPSHPFEVEFATTGFGGYIHNINVSGGNGLQVISDNGSFSLEGRCNGSNGVGVLGACYNGTSSIGVWGDSNDGMGGYFTTTSGSAAYFNGNIAGTGTFTYTSDAKLKKDILPINSMMNKIMQLKPSSYQYRVGEFGSMTLAAGKHYGVIAQDLQQLFPELVKEETFPGVRDAKTGAVTGAVNYLSVNYNELIPVLIKGMQEQQEVINKRNAEVEKLNTEVEKLTNEQASTTALRDELHSLKAMLEKKGIIENSVSPINTK